MAFVAVQLSAVDELPDFRKVAAGYRPLLDGDHDVRVLRVNRFAATGADVVALMHRRVNAHLTDVVALAPESASCVTTHSPESY